MKAKRKALAFLTALTFLSAGISAFNAYLPTSFTEVNAETGLQSGADFACKITASNPDADYSTYGAKGFNRYTADEATAAGIPAGFTGEVIEVLPRDGTINCGLLLDFTDSEIPFALVQALQFRVYLGVHSSNTGKYPQIRIPRPFYSSQGHWVYQRDDASTPAGEWTTVTVNAENTHASSFRYLQNDEGYLAKFELGMRTNSAIPFYIDSISYILAENDGVAPVITYSGKSEISTAIGAELRIEATAYDAQEQRSIEVQKVWSEGALDENGQLTLGTHTLTLTAADFFGNVSEKAVQVTVSAPDVQPPVIHLPEILYAETGSIPLINMPITDNGNVASTSILWSEGALDIEGKLTEGTHTLTVTAVDDSGNQAQKVATVYVTKDGNGVGDVIDEEELTRPEDSGSDSESDSDGASDSDSVLDSDTDSENSTGGDSTTDTTPEASDTSSETNNGTDSDTSGEQNGNEGKPEQPKTDSGCGSAIAFGTVGGVMLLGAALALKKRKED